MKDNGGPAFPGVYKGLKDGHVFECGDGISTRDWLAGMALQGEFASQSELTGVISSEKCMLLTAKRCYQMADAMLAERSKRDDG